MHPAVVTSIQLTALGASWLLMYILAVVCWLIMHDPAATMQAAYHGIGITVTPDKLVPVNGKPLQVALQKVLHEPQFKVLDGLKAYNWQDIVASQPA